MAAETELRIKVNADTQAIGGIKQVEKAIQQVAKDNEKASRLAGLLAQEYKLSEKEAAQVAAELRRVQAETDKAAKNAQTFQKAFEGVAQGIGQEITQNALGALKSAPDAIVGNSLREFGRLDAALTEFSAKSNIAKEDLGDLAEQSKSLAAETSQTPASVAELSKALLTLGATSDEAQDNLSGVTKLADVIGEDAVLTGRVVQTGISNFAELGETSDTLSDKLNTLINTTAAGSAQGIEEFFQFFQDVGPLAQTLEADFDELAAGFATLRDSGFSAATGATGLRIALLRLSAPSGEAQTLLEGLASEIEGVDNLAFTADGSFRGFEETLRNFQQATADLNNQEQLELAKKIFGDEGAPAILALLSQVDGKYQQTLQNLGRSAGSVDESLSVINQALVRQAELLQGQVSAALTSVGETFAPVASGVIQSASALISTFNALPAPIQSALIASTAFAAALGTATVVIAAYNLANRTRVATEVRAAAATVAGNVPLIARNTALQLATLSSIKFNAANLGRIAAEVRASAATITGNAAIAARAVVTQTVTAAQAAYAVATGRATVAQIAQNQAFVAAGVSVAAFAGAIAAVAVAVDTFNKVDQAASKLRDSVTASKEALIEYDKAADNIDPEVISEEAALNAEKLKEELGGVQNALDGLRSAIGLITDVEASTNRARVVFGELSLQAGEVEGRAFKMAQALKEGTEVDPSRIEKLNAAIDAQIALLKESEPTLEEDIRLRDAQIERFEKWKTTVAQAADEQQKLKNGTDDLANSTANLTDQIKELNDELSANLAELEANAIAQEAAIKEQAAAGGKALEQADAELAQNEQQLLQDRINATREKITELQEIKASTDDPEQLKEINAQILNLENQVNRDRIQLAEQTLNAQKEAEAEAEKAAKDAAQEKEKADREAAEERRKIAEEAAKAEADALKQQREDAKRLAEQGFEDDSTERQQQFDRDRAAREEALETRLNDLRREGQKQIETLKKSSQESLQADAEAFQRKQQAEQKAFQKSLDAERDAELGRIDAAAAAAERATQLRLAATKEEREALEEQFRQEDERARILAEEQERALDTTTEGEDLSPVEQARQDLEDRLQAKQEEFQAQQLAERDAFEDELQAKREDNEAEIAEIQKINAEEIDAIKKRAADEERRIEQAFQEQERERDRAFKDEQRQLDRQNAEQIRQILEQARQSTPIEARREGGPVAAGKPYLVGEEGPELIFPSRSGYVATARETAALMGVPAITAGISPNQVQGASMRGVEQRLDQLIEMVASDRQLQVGGNSYTLINESNPYGAIAELQASQLKALIRRRGL